MWIRILLLSLAWTVVGCGGEQALDGPTIFANQCARCHGPAGEGETGPALGSNGRLPSMSDSEIRSVIAGGRQGTAMPAFSRLSDIELTSLVSYLRSLP